jgi:large subunit ribosomal protein L15
MTLTVTNLSNLTNTTRSRKKIQRVGRGLGSGRGQTACRGQKGQKARSGYKRRYGQEGGQMKLYRKLPVRGFTRGGFAKPVYSINLKLIDELYQDGDVVSVETLQAKGHMPTKMTGGLKILSMGELTKKVTIEAKKFSQEALRKLEEKKISYKILE